MEREAQKERPPSGVRAVVLALYLMGGLGLWFGLVTLFFGPESSWSPWQGLISAPAALVLGWAIRRGYRLARSGCLIWWVVMTASSIVAYGFGLGLLGFIALTGLFVLVLYVPDSEAFFARGPVTSKAEDRSQEAVEESEASD